MPRRLFIVRWCAAALLFVMFGCGDSARNTLTLATTTSTRDSGLLDVLVPMFEEQTGVEVKVLAVGSGQALELGRRGDADVLLTHAPEAEESFVAEGHGVAREPVMYNDFVVVGPGDDPAKVADGASVAEAFKQIATSQAPFVSRGDESGTHMKEQSIWRAAGIEPAGDWYFEAGAGMAEALRMADQKAAYTLTDRSTFLAQQSGLALAVLAERDSVLRNPYSVIIVSPRKHPHINAPAARRMAIFFQSDAARRAIAGFRRDRFDQPLFFVEK